MARYLRPSRESFEGKGGGYLKAKAGLRDYFRERMGVGSADRVIGLSWKSAAPETGAARSLGLEELVSALSAGGSRVRFVNLQYGDVESELRGVSERLGIEVYSESEVDNREDLEGLAGLIEACDEVVSVGNATAHLSGALGQKTWVTVVGYGRDAEMWVIEHAVLRGDPGNDSLWNDLDGYLSRKRETDDGRSLLIEAAAIDSGGHFTQQVYGYAARRKARRIWAIKGALS